MQPDPNLMAASRSWIARAFGTGALPPPRFTLTLQPGPGGPPPQGVSWVVRSFVLEEQVHEPFVLTVTALADTADFELEAMVGVRLDLEIARGEAVRVVHGVVLEAALVGDHGDGRRVCLEVGPTVALAGLGRRCRVFQGRSVVEIAEAVLGPQLRAHGSELVVERLTETYAPRDYCVQYRESDLGFVQRLLADEGITILFDHEGDQDRVVLVDDGSVLPFAGAEPLGEGPESVPAVPFIPDHEGEVPTESIQAVAQHQRIGRGRWVASVWDWMARPPTLSRATQEPEHPRSEATWIEVDEGRSGEAPGDGQIEDPGPRRVSLHQRRDEVESDGLTAHSNATVLRAGSVFELVGPPHDGYTNTWLVTQVRHEGDVPEASVHGSDTDAKPQYRNTVTAQPSATSLTPAARPHPEARGIHLAVVTGPPGESIHTDRYGRIRVRMLWDEQAHDQEETSCWLRVAQPWAGQGFGTVFVPRVGSEVVVSFVDGDPDRPLCTGSLYDGGNVPPYALPEHKTRTVLRTAGVDADGYNELSFEDRAGNEEVYLHAQRNLRERIKGNHTSSVGDCQRTWIGGSRTVAVSKGDLLQVEGDQTRVVGGSVSDRVRGGIRMRVSETPAEPTEPEGFELRVEHGHVDIEAKDSIVLRCGESRLELRPNGIHLSGPEIVARCPSEDATHPTSLVLTGGTIEQTADALRQRMLEAETEADRRIALGVGPNGETTSLRLDDGAGLRTKGEGIVQARTLEIAGTETAAIRGTTCDIAGELVGISGKRIGIDADSRIEISTDGQVNVRGKDKITLN